MNTSTSNPGDCYSIALTDGLKTLITDFEPVLQHRRISMVYSRHFRKGPFVDFVFIEATFMFMYWCNSQRTGSWNGRTVPGESTNQIVPAKPICTALSLLQLMSDRDTFRDLELPRVIDTADTEFVSEFYTPLLSRAVSYDRGSDSFRAAGSSQLRGEWLISQKMVALLDGSRVQFLEDDWEAIKQEWKPRRMRY